MMQHSLKSEKPARNREDTSYSLRYLECIDRDPNRANGTTASYNHLEVMNV